MSRNVELESTAREVETSMLYLAPEQKINRRFVWPGHEMNTGENRAYDVTVRDGRTIKEYFNLDIHGFELTEHQSKVSDFHNNDIIGSVYAAEIAELVKHKTGADLVATPNWMVRTSGDIESEEQEKAADYTHNGGKQPVAGDVHVDTNQPSSEGMARMAYEKNFSDEPAYKRFIVLSLWRPFSPAPQDWPLAVCDYHSVADSEGTANALVVVDEKPDAETMFAPMTKAEESRAASIFEFNENHRWWYFSRMNRDEVLMFKFYDSDHSKAWRVPHVAFKDPSFADAQERSSIEFRAVAYFK